MGSKYYLPRSQLAGGKVTQLASQVAKILIALLSVEEEEEGGVRWLERRERERETNPLPGRAIQGWFL